MDDPQQTLNEKKAARAAEREARRQAAEEAEDGTAGSSSNPQDEPCGNPQDGEEAKPAAAFVTEAAIDDADETSLIAAPTDAESRAAKEREDAAEAKYYKGVGQHLAASREAIGELQGVQSRASKVQQMLEQAERALREADAMAALDDDD